MRIPSWINADISNGILVLLGVLLFAGLELTRKRDQESAAEALIARLMADRDRAERLLQSPDSTARALGDPIAKLGLFGFMGLTDLMRGILRAATRTAPAVTPGAHPSSSRS